MLHNFRNLFSRILLLTLLIISSTIYAQEDERKNEFKLYSSFDYSPKNIDHKIDSANGYEIIFEEKEIRAFNISPAFVFVNKKGNSSELELSRIGYYQNYDKEFTLIDSTGVEYNVEGAKQNFFELFIRYEYKWHLFKKKKWEKFAPIIGVSATPFYQGSWIKSLKSTDFPISKMSYGMYFSAIPRLEYNFTEKLFIDLNVPINFLRLAYTRVKTEDPRIPVENRTTSGFSADSGPISFSVRLGIGYRF